MEVTVHNYTIQIWCTMLAIIQPGFIQVLIYIYHGSWDTPLFTTVLPPPLVWYIIVQSIVQTVDY